MGQRPWSRIEIARMVKEARDNLKQLCKEEDRDINCLEKGKLGYEILKNLETQFAEEITFLDTKKYSKFFSLHPLSQIQTSYTFLDSPSRIIPLDNGVGNIRASLNPLIQNKEGRHYVDGSNIALETQHWFRLTKFFSFNAVPRFEDLFTDQKVNDVNIIAQNLYGKFTFHKFELEFGRDSLVWGQGEHGGIIISDNARPLDMIKLSNDRLIHIPVLGNFKGTFYFANLGPEQQYFKNSFFTGGKLSFEIARWLELGFANAVIMGGQEGAPSVSFKEGLGEFFFSRGSFLSLGASQQQNLSNGMRGGEIRITIPQLRGALVYYELYTDDVFYRFKSVIPSYGGIYFPRVDFDGHFDLRFEFNYVPATVYRHGVYKSGWTLNGLLLGEPIGPDATSYTTKMNYLFKHNQRIGLDVGFTINDGDVWKNPANGTDNQMVIDNPSERRTSTVFSYARPLGRSTAFSGSMGYEHVSRFNFEHKRDSENFLVAMQLNIALDKFFVKKSK